MILDPDSFYHERSDPKEKIHRDSEWINELQAAQKFAQALCVESLKLPKRTSRKQLCEALKQLIQEGAWNSEGKEMIQVPLLEQVVTWPASIPAPYTCMPSGSAGDSGGQS